MELLQEALKQGIAPSAVVAIYLVISKIIDSKKETTQIKVTSQLTDSINSINVFLNNFTRNIVDIDRDKCRAAIEYSLFSTAMRLTTFVSSTIINNHIDVNKEAIISNIKNIANSEFYTMFSTLSMYEVNGVKASDYLNKEWMGIIEQDMIDTIYNSFLTNEDKILSFSNKITLKFESYITFITNNVVR